MALQYVKRYYHSCQEKYKLKPHEKTFFTSLAKIKHLIKNYAGEGEENETFICC
jgi:hypothetical protein